VTVGQSRNGLVGTGITIDPNKNTNSLVGCDSRFNSSDIVHVCVGGKGDGMVWNIHVVQCHCVVIGRIQLDDPSMYSMHFNFRCPEYAFLICADREASFHRVGKV